MVGTEAADGARAHAAASTATVMSDNVPRRDGIATFVLSATSYQPKLIADNR
jgi:hypothetical protein